MDVAASVITIVGLALHSTQAVYKVVSSIIDAPQTLQHLTSNLRDLAKVLEELNGFGDDLYLASELPRLSSKCAENTREFESILCNLCSPKEKKIARLWKNVKATLQEDKIVRMSALLQRDFTALSYQINVIQFKRLERIDNNSSKQAGVSTMHTTLLESTQTSVDQISTMIGDLQVTSQASIQKLTTAMQTTGDKVLNVANMSTEQSTLLASRTDSIFELLQRLQMSEVSQSRETGFIAHKAIESSSDQETDKPILGHSNNCLEDAVDRLSKLVKEKEQTLFSVEAESIIEDVEEILAYLLKAEECYKHQDIRKKGRRSYDESDAGDDQDEQYQHDIERMKRLLNASDCIALKEKVGPCQNIVDKRLCFKTMCRVRSFSNGTLTIKARHGIHGKASSHYVDSTPSADEGLESFDVSVTYVPKSPRKAHIAFVLSQRRFLESLSLRIPVLSVSALLSDNSEVFQVIKNGDSDRLLKMMSLREASLTDRDTNGRCLLNYACQFSQPNICKWLIHEGANVDFVEPNQHGILVQYGTEEQTYAPTKYDCTRQLLEAGADPTVKAPPYNSWFESLLCGGAKVIRNFPYSDQPSNIEKESLVELFSHGFDYIASSSDLDLYRFVLLYLSKGAWTLDGVTFFLQMSGSKLPVQNLECTLDKAIHGSPYVSWSEFLEVLILLINAGADVNSHGDMVSKIVCNPRTRYSTDDCMFGITDSLDFENFDLRLRQIWVEGLTACGYNAEEFILRSASFEERSDIDGEDSQDSEADLQINEEYSQINEEYSQINEEDAQINEEEPEFPKSGTRLEEDDISPLENQANFLDLGEAAFNSISTSGTECIRQPPFFAFQNTYDWALLEEDTYIWRD